MYQDPTIYPLKSCEIVQMPKSNRKQIFNLYVTGIIWRTAQWVIRAPDQYYTQGWKDVFKSMKSAKVRRLVLDLNQRPTILKHICNIEFLQLKELWLHGNQIESIEILSIIKMEKLQCLSLSDNKLTQIESLAKCKYSFLNYIYLQKNKGLKVNKLQRCNLKNMFQFALQWDKKDPIVLHDSNNLCKLSMRKKGLIRMHGSLRIKQKRTYQSLCNGFDQCTIII